MSNSLLSSAVIAVIIVIVSGYVVSYNADIGTVADMVFAGMLDAAYATHGALSLIAVSSIADSRDLYLNGASDITIFKSDGNTYAAVAASGNRGVQILDITNPSNITAAGQIKDSATLKNLKDITTFKLDGDTYAAITSFDRDNVQVLNLADPLNIVVTGNITGVPLELNGAWGITTFKSGSDTYAAVAANIDDGVQILNVTDPSEITAISSIDDDNTHRLQGVKGITAFESRGHTYVAVASSENNGVEILNVTTPSSIVSTDRIGNNDRLELLGASGITSFKLDSGTYVAVTATAENGVQILNVTNPSGISAAGSISNADSGLIDKPTDITTFKSNDHTYLAVVTSGNSGVLILDATDPSNIILASSIIDTNAVKLDGASGITTFESGGITYAAVAASDDDAVQIIRVNGTQSTTDNKAPRIILNGSADVQLTVGDRYDELGANCEDDVDADKDATVGGDTVDINTVAQYVVTYNCTDSENSAAPQVTRTVTVQADSNTPPQVDAGPDLPAAIRGQEISLLGATATDAETPDTLTYAWTVSPIGAVTFNSTAALNPTITVADDATAGQVTLRLTVNDGTVSVSDSKTFTVQVNSVVNTAPTVDAGPPQTITKGDSSVTLRGATATDTEDDASATPLGILWTQDPPNTVTIDNDDTIEPTITVLSSVTERTVTLTLTATDSAGATAFDTKVLTLNTPPRIDAGDALDVTKGASVELLGATAVDDDAGDTLRYAWTSDPTNAVTFNDANLLKPRVTAALGTTHGFATLTLTVNDGFTEVEDTVDLTLHDVVVNNPPRVDAGPDREVTEGDSITLSGATASDVDRDALTYIWTQDPPNTVTFNDINSLKPRITASAVSADTTVTLTLSVNDTEDVTEDIMTLTVKNFVNTPPTVKAGPDVEVYENRSVTLSGSATDINRHDTLGYTWELTSGTPDIVLGVTNTTSLSFIAPGVPDDTEYVFTLGVTDGEDRSTDTVTVTVINVPISVLDALYNPGSGHLTITFNQDVDMADYTNIHIRGTGDDGITLSSVIPAPTFSDRTITATLNSTQKETYAGLTGPYLEIASGAVTDTDGDTIESEPEFDIRLLQKKKSSSSSAPIVDLNRLVQARIVDIPPVISEQVSSRNADDPLEPILHNSAFDFPLAINDYYYLLDSTTNTLTPRVVTAGQPSEIEFTVYTDEDLAHFTLYLNMQGDDVNYSDSDTYITYTNDGTVTVTDPNGYIADATITVTQDDSSMPEKKTVTITIEFDEPMGLTNMVAYMWNTDRRATIISLIDAIDVTADAETRQNSASTAGSSTSARVTPEPDVSDDNRSDGGGSQSSIDSGIAVIGGDANGDDDDVQTLSLIRMWSGFASGSITDAELLESLGLEYQDVHIPNWVMTDLAALTSKGSITTDEFVTALTYVLENI